MSGPHSAAVPLGGESLPAAAEARRLSPDARLSAGLQQTEQPGRSTPQMFECLLKQT